ncbi:MAG TPA: leucyl aminopeptidase family protein [Woeseiaceae bacterium]|nr:leucyl aminopeptidase family protein [Woeseiaceae bacterium]
MHALLNDSPTIPVSQHTGRISSKSLVNLDQLLLVVPDPAGSSAWKLLPEGTRLQAAAKKMPQDSAVLLHSRLNNQRQTLVVGGKIAADASAFQQLTLARKLVAVASKETGIRLGIFVAGFDSVQQASITKRMLAAALAASFHMPAYKSQPKPKPAHDIVLLGLAERIDISRVQAEANGNNLARWLTCMPPNKLDAIAYTDILKSLADHHGWHYKRYSLKELRKSGAGAFLAVAQGNQNDSACIVRLRSRPGKKTASVDLSLVGKGIIFDTGGTNLKPFQSMLNMHADMQGSAVALGTLLAMTELGLPYAVDCWLAITENRIGPEAYKSRDIVTAANGKTIQTIHTDAEGRMVLADTLVFASRDKPKLIVDFATLTGSCIGAITTHYSGVFSNRAEWHPRLKRTGQVSGERVWPFPIGKEFMDELKSDVADLKQCSVKGTGDHILAASFLAEFVEHDTPWIHIDLSAGENEGGLAHIPSTVTGFGVHYTLSLLLDEKILEAGA